MGAVLSCGPGAVLSHFSAAALWGIRPARVLEVCVPVERNPRRTGIAVHRREWLESRRRRGIPVTTPADTLIDIAPRLTAQQLERAMNEADKLDLVSEAELRAALDASSRPGVAALRAVLDRATFVMTETELEQAFLPIAARAGLSKPQTQAMVNGYRVDFYWPDLGLVVETDGGRFHRTAAQQTKDRVREHAHFFADTRHLRFTHWQVKYEPKHVERLLAKANRAAGR